MSVSLLSQVIEQTVNDPTMQSGANLARVAEYFRDLSTFVMNSQDLMVNKTVSS